MNRFLKLGVIALGLAAVPAFSQTNPATLATSITIIAPITFTVGATLNFGNVAASSVVGNNDIHVNALSIARTIVGGGNGKLEPGITPAVGTSSMVSGIYPLTVVASGLTTAGSGLLLTDITLSHDGFAEASAIGAGVSFTPTGPSPTALSFGGTMNVTNAATAGTYAGSFVVTGTYN